MTDKLPPNLLALFSARPPLRYLPPTDHPPEERKTSHISGVGQYVQALKDYNIVNPPTESVQQKHDKKIAERKARQEQLVTEDVKDYDPKSDPQVHGDPFRTLFVSRLSYDTEVKDLEREFGRYGPIERVRIVKNKHADDPKNPKKANRGYAFILYEKEKDMKAAYKETDGIRIRDRRVLVDVERGRTVQGWRPRRFGGGLGGRGYTKQAPARPLGGAYNAPAGPGGPGGPGGFRGSFGGGGGGFRGGRGGGGFRGRGGYGRGGGGGGGYSNGFAPEGAPSGPRGRGGGFGGGYRGVGYGRGGYGGHGDGGSSGADYDNRGPANDDRGRQGGYGGRHGGGFGVSGGNSEPIGSRGSGSYRDRDREGGYGGRDDYRKRPHDGDGYDDPRSKKRY
ncbi:MAG: hypothetical protein M1820_003348 [Bogoriella megaspora]|nr:MAG: hypothetical protein M1820_003348 [Bogoriella megaspora]